MNPDEAFEELSLWGCFERPDPLAIPLLSTEEKEILYAKRAAMPFELTDSALLHGDLQSILESKLWNPKKRTLTSEEMVRLARLVSEYRYFRLILPIEIFRNGVKPELQRLREAGAYIEYSQEEGPPQLEELRISHAEPWERPGFMRLFCFWPEDYPELNYQEQVERERSLERFVQIYELINGPVPLPGIEAGENKGK